MTTNIEICDCGDCESAMQRGMKFACEEMDADNCPTYWLAIAIAIQGMAARMIHERTVARYPEFKPRAVWDTVAEHCYAIQAMTGVHLKANEREVMLTLGDALCAFEARLSEDKHNTGGDKIFDNVDISELLKNARPRKTD